MFRLSKITDYGIVLLAHLARHGGDGPIFSFQVLFEIHIFQRFQHLFAQIVIGL